MKQRSIIAVVLLLIIICGVCGVGRAGVNVDIGVNGGSIIKIMDDIYIPGNKRITGDVIAVLGDIEVDGPVAGDVVAILGDIKVNNVIDGDLVSLLGNVDSGPNAIVKGEITKIGGPRHDLIPNLDFNFSFITGFFGWGFSIFRVIILYGLAVLVFVLIPKHQRRMAAALKEEPVRKLFIGLIALFALPVVISAAGISLIGIPLIPFMILSFIVAKFIGYVAVVLAVGERIRSVGNLEMNIFLQVLAGVVILWLIRSLAIIGFISYLIVTMLALGTIIDTKFGTNNPWFNKEEFKGISEYNDEGEEE